MRSVPKLVAAVLIASAALYVVLSSTMLHRMGTVDNLQPASQMSELTKAESVAKLVQQPNNQFAVETPASAYTNLSAAFISTFCENTLSIENNPNICLYDLEEDIFVSKDIKYGGLWDGPGVRRVLEALRRIKSSGSSPVFIDLGANIGAFSLATLSAGFDTISVEPMESALTRLATALTLNNLTTRCKLLNYAVTDRRACLRVRVNQSNKGGSEVQYVPCSSRHHLQSVTLDDLLPHLPHRPTPLVIKMDIQQYEPHAILSGRKLLAFHDVRLLYMEWEEMGLALKNGTNPDYMKKAGEAMDFLTKDLNFSSYHSQTLQKLKLKDRLNWPQDIYMTNGENRRLLF